MASLPDACPVCPDPPFDRGACPALSVQPSEGGHVTSHECSPCGSTWRTWRDIYGWPIVRAIDPVSPAEAEIHRQVIALALAEQRREARYAVA